MNLPLLMNRALTLARRGLYSTDPNPRVGCVLVKNNKIIGEGFHHQAGKAHAEINALNNATESPEGADVFVNLEPCAHFGRTPPCAEALIKAKVKRVFIATRDPNPLVQGKGIQILNQASIETVLGIGEDKARQINLGFFKRFEEGRAFIRLKAACSLDGKTALLNRQSQWITGAESRKKGMLLRARASAILTGVGTVLSDNPQMNVRLKNARQPFNIILDSQFQTPLNAQILKNEKVVIVGDIPPNETVFKRQEQLKNQAQIVEFPTRHLNELIPFLTQKFSLNEIHLEAGATLNGAFLNANLIDEIQLFIAPVVLGNDAFSLFNLPQLLNLNEKKSFTLSQIRKMGSDAWLTLHPSTPNFHGQV